MRILYFVECFWPYVGGVEVVSAGVLPELARREFEISVVTFRDTLDLPEREEYAGLDVRRAGHRPAIWARDVEEVAATRQRVLALKRELEPDLVHAVLTGPASFFFHVATQHADRAPTLLSFHGPHGSDAEESLLRRALPGAAWVTGCSNAVVDHLLAAAPEIAGRLSLLPNGLDPPGFDPAPIPTEPPVLLCASRFSPEKGLDVAVDALALVHRDFPTARLVLAGGGQLKEDLVARVAGLGLADAVDFVGWSSPPAVASLIDRATIVLTPSRREGFGLTALQGMLGGRPVVASRVDGLPEVLGEEGGLLVEPDDPPALARAIVRVLSDPSLRRRLRQPAGHGRWSSSRFTARSTPTRASIADSPNPAMLPDHARLTLASGRAVAKVIDGDAIVIDTVTGRYYSLEGTGEAAWSLLVSSLTIRAVAEALGERYDTAGADVLEDVRRLAGELLAENLLEEASGAAEPAPPRPPAGAREPYTPPELTVFRDMEELLAFDPPLPATDFPAWDAEPGHR